MTTTPVAPTRDEPPFKDNSGPPGSERTLNDVLEQSRKLQQLVQQASELRDPVARALTQECLQALLSFYGQGLARVLHLVGNRGADGEPVLERLLNDPVLRTLLLIHGLHPVDSPTRLSQAIQKVRPYMESHGGSVELLSLESDFARFRLGGACKTCPSSSVTMELALRSAIEEFCPDLAGFEVEGLAPAADGKPSEESYVPGHSR